MHMRASGLLTSCSKWSRPSTDDIRLECLHVFHYKSCSGSALYTAIGTGAWLLFSGTTSRIASHLGSIRRHGFPVGRFDCICAIQRCERLPVRPAKPDRYIDMRDGGVVALGSVIVEQFETGLSSFHTSFGNENYCMLTTLTQPPDHSMTSLCRAAEGFLQTRPPRILVLPVVIDQHTFQSLSNKT